MINTDLELFYLGLINLGLIRFCYISFLWYHQFSIFKFGHTSAYKRLARMSRRIIIVVTGFTAKRLGKMLELNGRWLKYHMGGNSCRLSRDKVLVSFCLLLRLNLVSPDGNLSMCYRLVICR